MAMPKIEFRCQMFRGDWDQVWSQRRMVFLMEALCRVNQTHLQEFEALQKRGLIKNLYPSVYRSGLHYETEKNTEIWPDIPSLLEGTMGTGLYPGPWGDCEDLACYRVAELRELPLHYERPSKIHKGSATQGKTEYADPRFPQEPSAVAADLAHKPWPGWKMVKGGITAMPFAKWRRGPEGQYHYHALVLTPEGRLEDPSLVLGMGREKDFSENGMAEKLKSGTEQVVLQYAKNPEVVVVDPEKPSGYGGGKAKEMDEKILSRLKDELKTASAATQLSGDARELRAYAGNPLGDLLGKDGIADLDAAIGWSRKLKQFVPYDSSAELRRLTAYGRRSR